MKEKKGIILSIFKFIGWSGVACICLFVYNGWLRQPKIECFASNNEINFYIEEEYRNVTLMLHPQLVVQFDNYIILSVYLKGYYEEERLVFNREKTCKTIIMHPEYVEKLQKYMEKEIIQTVCLLNPDMKKEEMNYRLKIYISTIGGVSYQSEEGNRIKRYCVIENGGSVRDVDEHSEEIEERLYEAKLTMKDDGQEVESQKEINTMIQGVAEEIVKLYTDTGSR